MNVLKRQSSCTLTTAAKRDNTNDDGPDVSDAAWMLPRNRHHEVRRSRARSEISAIDGHDGHVADVHDDALHQFCLAHDDAEKMQRCWNTVRPRKQ